MSGRDDQYLNQLRRKRNDELWWDDEKKRNDRHHKKMKDIIPLEEEIKVLNQKLKQIKTMAPRYFSEYYPGKYRNGFPPDYPMYRGMPPSNIIKKEIMNIEKLIRRTDKKISTIMGRI